MRNDNNGNLHVTDSPLRRTGQLNATAHVRKHNDGSKHNKSFTRRQNSKSNRLRKSMHVSHRSIRSLQQKSQVTSLLWFRHQSQHDLSNWTWNRPSWKRNACVVNDEHDEWRVYSSKPRCCPTDLQTTGGSAIEGTATKYYNRSTG